MQHLVAALRRIRAQRTHAAMVVAILTVGTASAATIYRVVDAALLRSLPYRSPDQLVSINERIPIPNPQDEPLSDVTYQWIARGTRTLDGIAAYTVDQATVTLGGVPQRLVSASVTASFFRVLGTTPLLGRPFDSLEDVPNGPAAVMLSAAAWRTLFGSDPRVVGTSVQIDGTPHTIVGVAAEAMTFPRAEVAIWLPLQLDANGSRPFDLSYNIIARLKHGMSVEGATADATRLIREAGMTFRGPHAGSALDPSGFRALLHPIRDTIVGGLRTAWLLLALAVSAMLALTCVNVATLQLIRASSRRAEYGIRAALGATRRRLVGEAATEGALLSLVAGVGGLVLSAGMVAAFAPFMPASVPASATQGTGTSMVAMMIVVVLLASAAIGVVPVALVVGTDLEALLRNRGGVGGSRGAGWTRRALVVTQMSLAAILLYGAGLLAVSARRVEGVAPGLVTDHVLRFDLFLSPAQYRDGAAVSQAYHEVASRIRAIPGVQAAAIASSLPLGAYQMEGGVGIEGTPFKADGSDPTADLRIIDAGYFETLGIRLLAGTGFREGDAYLDGTPVVINESLARRIAQDGSSPLGRRIRLGPFAPWSTIIGITGDTKNRSLTAAVRPEIFLPMGAPRSPLGVQRNMAVVVRYVGDAGPVVRTLRSTIRALDPLLAPDRLDQFTSVIRNARTQEMAVTRVMIGFALTAVVLAVAGCYATLAFSVAQRTRELAVRRAIGATPRAAALLVLRDIGRLVLIASPIGLLGGLMVAKLLGGFLFGVRPFDLPVIVVTAVLLGGAAFLSAAVPARRAASVDPMLALRAGE